MENLKSIIEALLFASEVPLSVTRVREILTEIEKTEIEKSEILNAVQELVREYGARMGEFILKRWPADFSSGRIPI